MDREKRYNELATRSNNDEELTDLELDEQTQLYYELHPEDWDGGELTPEDVFHTYARTYTP